MSKKYSGYNENDTAHDEYFKERGMMTNSEFFRSNEKGGFYEGMVYDEEREEWVLNDYEQRKADEREAASRCSSCGYLHVNCDC